MQYTNRAELPKEIVSAITKERYLDENDLPSDYSASRLINPIQMTVLQKRYPDKQVIEDVMDAFFRFKGSVGHQVLEDSWHESMGSRIEERFYTNIMGKTVSGKFDCYDHINKEIRDYKFTKSYKIQRNDFTEWEIQQNIYAELLRRAGYEVNKISIWAFIEDYKKMEAYKPYYPKEPIINIPLRLWSSKEISEWMNSKVFCLESALTMTDKEIMETYPCSPKECWQDTKDWAIMKDGGSKATKCFDNKVDATDCFKEKYEGSGYTLIQRLTPPRRCDNFCSVRNICSQTKKRKEELNGPESSESTPF